MIVSFSLSVLNNMKLAFVVLMEDCRLFYFNSAEFCLNLVVYFHSCSIYWAVIQLTLYHQDVTNACTNLYYPTHAWPQYARTGIFDFSVCGLWRFNFDHVIPRKFYSNLSFTAILSLFNVIKNVGQVKQFVFVSI